MTISDAKKLGYLATSLMMDTPIGFGKYKDKTYNEILCLEDGVGYLKYLAKSKNSSVSLPAKMALKRKR